MSKPFGKDLENFGKLPPAQEPSKLSQRRRSSPAVPDSTPRKIGRPPGKKSDPSYTQVTVYLRRDVHRAAKKRLLDDGKDFSELVDELVSQWLQGFGSLEIRQE